MSVAPVSIPFVKASPMARAQSHRVEEHDALRVGVRERSLEAHRVYSMLHCTLISCVLPQNLQGSWQFKGRVFFCPPHFLPKGFLAKVV